MGHQRHRFCIFTRIGPGQPTPTKETIIQLNQANKVIYPSSINTKDEQLKTAIEHIKMNWLQTDWFVHQEIKTKMINNIAI